MTAAPATTSFNYVRKRKDFIDDALDFVDRTRELENAYGRQEEHRTQRLDDIESALQETDLRLVVIGEFSRGKSMLLNALVGEQILPTNDMQTTAINTFIYGVDDGEEPYLEIEKRDGDVERLPWEEHIIEKWGTELDSKHRDARREVDRIVAYSDHPLLQNDLVLIDTPGFQGLLEHHENIAHQAMNEAHVAIWLQATDQLGGNASEWEFVRKTVSRNFEKFITVINKWDKVLEPTNARERQDPVEVREERAIETVQRHFRGQCGDVLSDEALEMLTSDRNLLGVSAHWGLSDDPEKRERSGIRDLEKRIEEMCKSSEATQQIFAGPLRSLTTVHERLLETIKDELKHLEEAEELEDLESDIQQLDNKIESLELELDRELSDIRSEHDRYAGDFQEDIRSELVQPLKQLAEEVDLFLDKKKLRRQLESGSEQVGLPSEIKSKLQQTTREVDGKWRDTRSDIEDTLEALAESFRDGVSGVIDDLEASWSNDALELKALDLEHSVDLGAFEEYQRKRNELEMERRKYEEKLDDLETSGNQAQLESLKEKQKRRERRLEQIEAQRANMGPEPAPRTYKTKVKEERDGIVGWVAEKLFGKKEKVVTERDESNVEAHRQEKRELKQLASQQEEAIQEIIDEYRSLHGTELNRKKAERKYRKKLKRKKREVEKFEKKQSEALDEAVDQTYARLHRSTVQAIQQMAKNLSEQVSSSVQTLFDRHCDQLEDAVQEQYLEPLSTRRDMRADKIELMQKKESELEERKTELRKLRDKLEGLMEDTSVMRTEVRKLHAG